MAGKIEKESKYIIGILLTIFFLILAFAGVRMFLASDLYANLSSATGGGGETHSLSLWPWIDTPMQVILGENAVNSVEAFIIAIAVFIIVFIALWDIIGAFSSFKENTAMLIAFGLALIAGVTRVIEAIVNWFGITAALGAFGIGVIIIWGVIVAVVMNIIVGWAGIKAVHQAKSDQDAINTAASKMRKGFGLLKSGSDIVDTSTK